MLLLLQRNSASHELDEICSRPASYFHVAVCAPMMPRFVDPVFLIMVRPEQTPFATVVTRTAALASLELCGSANIKISEIDDALKSEYKNYLSRLS
jgi:hypothetical protein